MNFEIRRADPDDAAALTELAHAAKRHWRYPESWIAHWKSDLTITPEFIAVNEVFVATIDNEIAGCCALVVTEKLAELEHMWINPKYMGNGVGRALFTRVRERAQAQRFHALEITADPNAEGFYERMGAMRIGDVTSEIEGQPRVLPRMKAQL
jgi:N-acetylglutamate synthase-like GNAT family acetyltransferase